MVQKPVKPLWQFLQKPHATLKGMTTLSPAFSVFTAEPTSSTIPMFSWPKIMPGSAAVLPSYMCRSGAADAGRCYLDDYVIWVL